MASFAAEYHSHFYNSAVTIANAHSVSPLRPGPPLSPSIRTRAGVAALWLIAHLPLRLSRALGWLLGELMYRLNAKRRHIAQVNIDLCFPKQSPQEKSRLIRSHFRLLGQSYLDIAFLGWASERRVRNKTRIRGLDHLKDALVRHQQVILLAPHCLGMNVGGIAVSRHYPVFSMYKRQRSELLNWMLAKVRSRYGAPLFAREQGLRPVLRALEQGVIFYYLPDEDFGPRHSVFAPFFGVTAATLPTLGRLAKRAHAVVVPCFTRLLTHGRGYEIVLHPPLDDFPTNDRIADAARMNAVLETGIREMPEQYMWTFKIFKTRPDGAPPPYAR